MRRKLRHLTTPIGRLRLRKQAVVRLVPLLVRLATAHRRGMGSRTRIVAVVGSLGKTTTTAALQAVLERGRPPAESNIIEAAATAVLGCWPWRRHAVVEAGIAKPGQMDRLAATLRPDLVVVTSIASEHHRSLGTLEATRNEKARMLHGLRPGGVAVLNGDDPLVRSMAAMTSARVITYGYGPDNHVRALGWRLDWPRGTVLTVAMNGQEVEIRSRLLGRALTYPLLAALAVASQERLDPARVAPALAALPPAPHRMALSALPDGGWLIDDSFKSTLETVDAALDVLAEIPGRRLVVIGDVSEPVGSQGPIYRRLGARLAGMADLVITLGHGHQRYAAGAVRAGMPRHALVDAGDDYRVALARLQAVRQPGDVILVKGRTPQRLARLALALAGRTVRCAIHECRLNELTCSRCPMLERSWSG